MLENFKWKHEEESTSHVVFKSILKTLLKSDILRKIVKKK